jgi:chromosome segregation protein
VRLNSIKLSGFKSFAEPTNFLLPGQLVGVVGPNGCGKSNIMDAVRWVLGESRASELRGESMQDVIFNGTTTRKQASRSSVELVFDNADHRAGGQWNQFGEIAVRRVLTRDGTSSYYINNQPVRRRDVQDVFLGTGLGPRAYAIIGQGTISRIIESKPEELRLFLEEAAGVSKYKERRRETENRLGDTRENLTRVEDILRELNANLEKLEKQAEVAARYNTLQGDATKKQHQLWFLKRSESDADQAKIKTDSEKAINDLESRTADLRHIEAELETVRQAHYAAGDQVNQAQGKLYEASAEVGRLEGEIRFVVEGRQRVEQRLVQLREQMGQWGTRREEAEAEIETLAGPGVDAEEQAILLAAQLEEHDARMPELEEAVQRAQDEANTQRTTVSQVQQQIQVLAADQRNIEDQSRQLTQRSERLRADQNALAAPDEARLLDMQEQLAAAQETASEADGPPARAAGSRAAARRRPPREAAGRQHRRRAPRRVLGAARSAACAAGKGQDRRQAGPLARQARPRRPAGPVEPHSHRAGLGKRARSRVARAPGCARSQPARHGPRLRQRRAAGQARVLQPAVGRCAAGRGRRCRACRACCA